MTARSTSISRTNCCSPCGLASVVTVAAGTTWGDATPCYASHMMLVLLYGYENKDFCHGLYGYENKDFCHGLYGYKNKQFFHGHINTQTTFKFPDKLFGNRTPTTTTVPPRTSAIQQHSGLHRCTSPKLRGRQRCPMTARSTSRSRASCCCACGLASVVTVAAGTTWGHATPCYASHRM